MTNPAASRAHLRRRPARGLLAALALGLSLGLPSAHAAGVAGMPIPAHTFVCTGTPSSGGPCPLGGRPVILLQAATGAFFGATQVSAEGSSNPQGGTVFALGAGGAVTLLHTFAPGASGAYPGGDQPSTLLAGPDGNLYGTTLAGGTHGVGVLYRLSPTGAGFQILHQFCSAALCADGGPGGLSVQGADGNLYGTTATGGSSGAACQGLGGCGTIFRVTPTTGAYTVLYRFNGGTDGALPLALTRASDGTLYGVAGTHLFHYAPATGAFHAVALPFVARPLPSAPLGALTLAPNGRLYGLYSFYGKGGLGLFTVAPDGSQFQQFAEFDTTQSAGIGDTMLLAGDGAFWVSELNGPTGYGDIVRVSPATGALLQTVTTFSATDASGAYPNTLVQAADGTLWGATDQLGHAPGGHFADGVVFSLSAGLPPPSR